MKIKGSKCDRCGEFVADLDAGFCPAIHGMTHHDCGGRWQHATIDDGVSSYQDDDGLEFQFLMHDLNS